VRPLLAILVALGAFGAAALGAAACSCPQTTYLVDDFEGCSGTCGWTIAGAGTATIVATILPGEHGLQLSGGVTASKTISPATIDTTFSFELVGACPNGLSAVLTATIPNSPPVSLAVSLSIDDSLTTSGDPPNYSGVTYVPLVGDINLPSGVSSAVVTQVTLEPAAGSPCTVDLIRLTTATPCNQ
jgi:hypothetical protein